MTATAIYAAMLLLSGCIGAPMRVYHITKDSKFVPAVTQLVADNREYFNYPYTFMIIIDSSPCVKALNEMIWWADWQEHFLERNIGFIIATSRVDSMDVVIAAELDRVKAPVLVFPSCNENMEKLDILPGVLPLKIMIDSAASIIYACGYIPDTTASNNMLVKTDTIIKSKNSVSNK